ncbi:leucine-rich repeat flightless-interacting protein 2 isoform X13 [Hippocampus comes]|uniref:leucine-rich repeat flightless-interacting protein 2 isoform X13 n=1 Tax=Hippocampus comes TaxID=109280 RepID=UPI00094EF5FD|nr:PREDICTED: leucine-rich repeat flightless-interacting protein 2-like isoform X13 [Hippocampus comes]
MGTQGAGRKRNSNKERSTAEDDALNLIAREAEARLAAKRAARAEAREIRMRELERQQKEIFQVQKKYYGLNPKSDDRSDSKWGDIEQWMEDSERYSRPSQPHTLSDDDERMSVGSRGSARSDLDVVYGAGSSSSLSHKSKKKKKHKHKEKDRNGHDDEYSVLSSRASYASSDLYSLNGLPTGRNPGSTGSYQSSLYEDGLCSGSRRLSGSNFGSHPLEYSGYRGSNSRTSSRANSARTSPAVSRPDSLPASHEMQPLDNAGSVASLFRSTSSSRGLPRDLDDVTIPDFSDVDDRDYLEKQGSRAASALTAATLASLGGTSSRRASVETAITVDAETATREIKEIHELKDQIQDVESKYNQNLKEVKEALTEVEEKYRKAMVSNAQLDNEKNNLMYQVDTLKDSLIELEELLSESRREYEEKVKDFEREKHAHSVLQFQFNEMKETLKQSEELLNEIRQLRLKQESFAREISDLQETVEWKDKKIGALERQKEYTDAIRTERDELREEVVKLKDILKKHGIVLGPDLSLNGDTSETETDVATSGGDAAPQQAQASPTSPSEGNSMLEIRLRKLVDEREKMIEQMKKLKAQVDQKSQKNGTDGSWSAESEPLENGNDPNIIELQRDSSRQISDMKFKLVKAEQEVTALEQNVSRLEGQVSRYKSAAENAEKVEDELKAEKRKLQRELRSALDKVDELESNNSHLNKRLEKMKSSRGMAQTP